MESTFFSTLGNSRLVFGIVTVVGLAMCSPGIGKAARLGLWVHPISIAGYLLGGLALLLAAQGLFRFRLLPVTSTQALFGILGIMVVKVLLATLYRA